MPSTSIAIAIRSMPSLWYPSIALAAITVNRGAPNIASIIRQMLKITAQYPLTRPDGKSELLRFHTTT